MECASRLTQLRTSVTDKRLNHRDDHAKKPHAIGSGFLRSKIKWTLRENRDSLQGLYNVAGTDATRTDLDALNGTVSHGLYLLQVGIPCSARFVVCVTYIIAEAGTLPADFADFGHDEFPPFRYEAFLYNRLRC